MEDVPKNFDPVSCDFRALGGYAAIKFAQTHGPLCSSVKDSYNVVDQRINLVIGISADESITPEVVRSPSTIKEDVILCTCRE